MKDRKADYRFEERAAIMEFEAGMSRAEAEKRAREDIERQRQERRERGAKR